MLFRSTTRIAFRGHDESDNSISKGNFLELLQFLADHNEAIHVVVVENTPGNNKLRHHDIQKDIVSACAIETTNAIVKDLENELFSILVDESRDVSVKEQMAIVVRFVDKRGIVTERFFGYCTCIRYHRFNTQRDNFLIFQT